MVCPKPHDFTPGVVAHDPPKHKRFGDKIMRPLLIDRARMQSRFPALLIALFIRESKDNIPNGSLRVRVQTVNAKGEPKKCAVKLIGAIFIKMNPLF
jgi:hypothetical protein